MVQRRQGLGFACEPSKPVRIVRKRVREDLERDIAIQLRIARAIDLSHAPFADRRGDFVYAKSGAECKGQVVRIIRARRSRGRYYSRSTPQWLLMRFTRGSIAVTKCPTDDPRCRG